MSKGNLIRAPYCEITSILELLDSLGVTPDHLANLRKASHWQRTVTAAVMSGDPYLLNLLSLEIPAKRVGFTDADFKQLLGDEELMRKVLGVVRGNAKMKEIEHLIDCDADPLVPEDWKVEEHRKCGVWTLDSKHVELYLSDAQRAGKFINGAKLHEELRDKPVLNANVLDWLLKHPFLIPDAWKGKLVFFWGTVYRGPGGGLHVRCLDWRGGGWYWLWGRLGSGSDGDDPAALCAGSFV